MSKNRGSVLIVFLFSAAALILFLQTGIFLIGEILERERQQSIADTTVLSVLRLRAKALETIAVRWDGTVGRLIGLASNDRVFSPHSAWSEIEKSSQELSDALPGYQSRLTALRTVLKGAYGLPENIVVNENTAALLGLSAQPIVLRDENGDEKYVRKGWYKRAWTVDLNQQPSESVSMTYRHGSSRGRLRWDVDNNNPDVRAIGNGGFPADWASAVSGGKFKPSRFPYFRAELTIQP